MIWQTGSGTQSNMNANEVIAGRANELLGGKRGGKAPVHPNDHVNMGQSSNDTFPTAMHIAAARAVEERLLPGAATQLHARARREGAGVGRHRQDRPHPSAGRDAAHARPGILGLRRRRSTHGIERVEAALPRRLRARAGRHRGRHRAQRPAGLRRGGRAREIAELTGLPFVTAPNKFEALAAHDALVELSGALNDARGRR